MKKNLIVALSSIFFCSCASNSDLIYAQDEELTSIQAFTNKETLALNTFANKNGENVVIDLAFPSGFTSSGGGCTFTQFAISGHIYENVTTSYGPIPQPYNGYQIRGYGNPRRFIDWKGLKMLARNEERTTTLTKLGTVIVDHPLSNAISIEYNFQPNATYEIIIETIMNDNIWELRKSDFAFDIDRSEAFATIGVELKDSPEIPGNDPCAQWPVVGNGITDQNHYKKQKAEMTSPPISQFQTYTFNFSLTESKKAFQIDFRPEVSGKVPAPKVPQSIYAMYIQNIKVIQKPFDSTYYSTGSGYR